MFEENFLEKIGWFGDGFKYVKSSAKKKQCSWFTLSETNKSHLEMMVGIRSFPFWGPAYFQGRNVSFTECSPNMFPGIRIYSGYLREFFFLCGHFLTKTPCPLTSPHFGFGQWLLAPKKTHKTHHCHKLT